MTKPDGPPTPLPGCTTLPPLEAEDSKGPKGKTAGTKTVKSGTPKKGNGRDRFAILNALVDFEMAHLTGAELRVWILLYRDTKAATQTARTGQADLARRTGLCDRSVRRGLVGLQRKGVLRVVKRGGLGEGASVYRVSAAGRPIAAKNG